MNKNIFIFIFLLPLICLMGWTGFLTYQQKNGQEVKVRITGYDPRDILSGHYIAYRIDWEKTDCNQFEYGICPKDDFCKTGKFANFFSWGAPCRFYVPEKYAEQLDKTFRNATATGFVLNGFLHDKDSKQDVFEVVYSYQKGREPFAKQLLINGKDWRDSIK